GIHFEGVVPSPTTFNGLWSWDSWKHAYALAGLDRELAENSIRAMYDYQSPEGMIPDCIFVDTNNFTGSTCVNKLTKPPLSGWAIWEVYHQTKDIAFIREMLPKLIKYHEWRYTHRDINHNGLCEVGANVNDMQSARYECWDDGIRFDEGKLLKKSDHCYSMNTESVDLNAYLFHEKGLIVKMARLLKEDKIAKRYEKEREILGKKIQTTFFDERTGFFYDVRIADGSLVMSKEVAGWIPLFAGAATPEQARRVKDAMMSDKMFNTLMPLPAASIDNPKFVPHQGYWRGPVWLDQFYFGYMGLIQYGYQREADALLLKLLKNGQGITDPSVELREHYDPLTGEAGGAKTFGWSAAHLLMMMLDR
ncbi:MAG: trehalase family glycosidase, partial [Verrucomicrobiota bacterium]